jgi:pyrimidine oxygenase
MDIGVFIPIGNNGWLISTSSPQYRPTFELNKQVVLKAEHYGFDFALSMIKLRGFGGKSEFWDHNLESFTLMAGLAAVTRRIQLYASVAVLTIPPAIVARMTSTIDSISGGRFGVNIVSGWAKAEYDQMGSVAGEEHYNKRYDYSTEYVTILRELWETGTSNFKGEYFQMEDCKLSPSAAGLREGRLRGQSPRGIEFGAAMAITISWRPRASTPRRRMRPTNLAMAEATAKTGRDVGNLRAVHGDRRRDRRGAEAKWRHYNDGRRPRTRWAGWRARPMPMPMRRQPARRVRWQRPRARSTSTWARWSAPMPRWRGCSTNAPQCPPPRASCWCSTIS